MLVSLLASLLEAELIEPVAGASARLMRIFLRMLCAAAVRMIASVRSVGLRSTLANNPETH